MGGIKGVAQTRGKSPHLLSEDACKGTCAANSLRLSTEELQGLVDAAKAGALPDERFAARLPEQPVTLPPFSSSCC